MMVSSTRTHLVAALAYRDFRLFWAGSAMAVAGRQGAMVAQGWLLYDLTGSALQLGLLGLARAVPAFVLGLAGGVVADRVDRRRLMIATTTGAAVTWVVLATLIFTGRVEVWHILGTSFLAGAIGAFEGPSRQSIFPHLIDRRHLTSAVAMTSAVNPASRIVTPIVAGSLIEFVGSGNTGPAAAFYFVGGLYLASSFLLFMVRMPRVQRSSGGGLQSLFEGLRYARTDQTIGFLLMMAFVLSFFGLAYTAMLPIFADGFSEGSSGATLGVLYSVGGLGGLAGAGGASVSVLARRRRLTIVASGSAFGLALIGFAFIPWYVPALVLLFLASGSENLFSVFAQSIMQSKLPDEYRGRVMGFWGMQFSVLHPLGNLQIGAIAAVAGAPIAVAAGGLAVIAFTIAMSSTKGIRQISQQR